MLGIVFSLLSAGCFALNAAAARRAVLSGTVLMGLAITVPIGVPLFYLLALALGETALLIGLPIEAYFWFAASGVVHFVAGRYCNYAASGAIGTNLAAPILQCDVLITLALAMLILDEQLTVLRIIGIALVLLGPSLVTSPDKKQSKLAASPTVGPASAAQASAAKASATFRPRYSEGYLLAALAATAYGVSPILIALGLKSAGGGSAVVGGLIAYVAATVVVLAIITATGRRQKVFSSNPSALRWFLLAGVFVFLSQAFRYVAYALAPVSVVTTLQRLSSIFRIYFGWLINREHEVFDRSVIVATVVSMLGAIILSVSTEWVLGLAEWPQWLVEASRWRWP